MDDRRYRGHRRHAAAHWGPAPMWMLVGAAGLVVGVAATFIAVGSHRPHPATVRSDATPSPLPAPGSPADAPDEPSPLPSASVSTRPSSASPSPARTSPSPVPGEFALALSATSGPVTAGAQLGFTVTTSVVSGTPGQVTVSVSGLPPAASSSVTPTSLAAGQATQVMISTSPGTPPGTYPVAVNASTGTAHHSAQFALTVNAVQPVEVVLNGGFESGLANWSTSGSASTVTSPVHGGSGAVRLGTPTPSGDTTISQTFTVAGTGQLSLWYQMVCADQVKYDWFDVSATDLTTNQSVTLVPKTCHTSGSYQHVTAALTVGHQYRLVVESRDDNHTSDASYTYVDDISVS
jgi:hypothetical protein